MRYELSDFEWTAIKPTLPNKTRGVRRVTADPADYKRHTISFGEHFYYVMQRC